MRLYNTIAARVRVAVGVSTVALIPLLGACSTSRTTCSRRSTRPHRSGERELREGALALYNGALAAEDDRTGARRRRQHVALRRLLADEWSTSSTFVQNDETDQRSIQINNSTVNTMYRSWRGRARRQRGDRGLKQWRPRERRVSRRCISCARTPSSSWRTTSATASRCPGSIRQATIVYDMPRPVAYVFQTAVASADSGLALIPATVDAAGDLLVRRALLVTKARALLGLGQIAEAAALVTHDGGARTFTYDITFATSSGDNTLWNQPAASVVYGRRLARGPRHNLLVKNAIPFSSAQDPRVPSRTRSRRTARTPRFAGRVDSLADDDAVGAQHDGRRSQRTRRPSDRGRGQLKANDIPA
jgi:hypothetical protein